MWSTAYKKAPHYFPAIPKRFRNYEIYLYCAKTDDRHARQIPKHLLDKTMIKHMIDNAKNIEILDHVPLKKRTKDICDYAYIKSPLSVLYTPQKWVSKTMYDQATQELQSMMPLPHEKIFHGLSKSSQSKVRVLLNTLNQKYKNYRFTRLNTPLHEEQKKRRHKMPSPV